MWQGGLLLCLRGVCNTVRRKLNNLCTANLGREAIMSYRGRIDPHGNIWGRPSGKPGCLGWTFAWIVLGPLALLIFGAVIGMIREFFVGQ